MTEDFDDPVRYNALVPIKWNEEHFHVVCDAYRDDEDVVFMIGRHLFPDHNPYSGSAHMIEYRCAHDSMRPVSNKEYRYLGTTLVDLDASQHWPLASPTEPASPDSASEQ
jgi:hypothetical protein